MLAINGAVMAFIRVPKLTLCFCFIFETLMMVLFEFDFFAFGFYVPLWLLLFAFGVFCCLFAFEVNHSIIKYVTIPFMGQCYVSL